MEKINKKINKEINFLEEPLRRELASKNAELEALKEKRESEMFELDRIAKMLIRRDFELTESREIREAELKKLEKRTKELEETRAALMNILEDIQKAGESAESERNKTVAIITNLTDGLLVFDDKNCLSLINPSAEIFFATEGEKVIGKFISEIAQFPNFKTLTDMLKEGTNIFRKELSVRDNLVLEVSAAPVIWSESRTGTLVVLHDITRDKLIEKMKTEFVSVAAHQLRTPLSAIKWTLKMLLEGDLGPMPPEQRDFIEKTYKSNERMINLINDLLDVTRIEEGRYLYRPVLAEIDPLVENVINSYNEEVKKRGIRLEFKKSEEKLPKVLVDAEKISLAIQNLFENAIKYTHPGGTVSVSLKKDKKSVRVSIKDTGVGIPEDQNHRVFSKFFRGANVMRMETEGSGLGLFIAKNIIEAHGGKIWFKSGEGKGTVFHFSLPAKGDFEELLKEI